MHRYLHGHAIGYCLSHPEKEYIFVPIPKNGSSIISKFLYSDEFTNEQNFITNRNILKNKIPIIILRDPIDRWISGIIEFVKRVNGIQKFNSTIDLLEQKLFSKIEFDEHTSPQYAFVELLNLEKSVFLYMNKNFYTDVCNFFNKELKIKFPDLYYNSQHDECRDKLYRLLKSIERIESIKKYYEKDYELINSVKFYNDIKYHPCHKKIDKSQRQSYILSN